MEVWGLEVWGLQGLDIWRLRVEKLRGLGVWRPGGSSKAKTKAQPTLEVVEV